MAIEILSDGAVVRTITHVLTASLCDKLDGTLTFDFMTSASIRTSPRQLWR